MDNQEDCLFCKIVKGEISSYKIRENANFLAILDIFPNCKWQTLVIAKNHYDSDLFEIEDAVETVREASNSDINIIFGAIKNENLNDEVIVTVIATGFDKGNEPLYFENRVQRDKPIIENNDDDSDGGSVLDIPPFLRNRKF